MLYLSSDETHIRDYFGRALRRVAADWSLLRRPLAIANRRRRHSQGTGVKKTNPIEHIKTKQKGTMR